MITKFLKIFSFLILFQNLAFCQNSDKKFELSSINFDGNDFVSAGMLKSILVSKETPFWFWKLLNKISPLGNAPNYFDSNNVVKDIKIIEAFYRDNGFFKASVSASWESDTVNYEAKISFNIIENTRSKVNSYFYPKLETAFEKKFYKDFFSDKYLLKQYQFYSKDLLQSDISNAISELRNCGYMLAEKEKAIIEIDTANFVVDITANINPGKYYSIDTILIEKKGVDAPYISDDLIIDIVNIEIGDKYNLSEINKAQVRLYRTELFTSALINTVILDSNKTQLPLKVSLDVGKINEISPEVLFNNQSSTFNIGLGANFIRKNFFGGARKLSMTGSVTAQDIFKINLRNVFGNKGLDDTTIIGIGRLTLGIEQPYFIENYITADLQFFANIEQQKIYKYYSIGSKLGFKFDLPQFTFFNGLNTFLGFETEKIYIRKDLFRDYLISFLKSTGTFYTDKDVNDFVENFSNDQLSQSNIIIGMDLFSNHSNDLFFPTLGYNFQINVENAGLLPMIRNLFTPKSDNNVQYYKINTSVTTYTNPWKPSIGAVAYKLRIGYMQKYNGDRNIPITKLFYVGGSNSVRGWAARALGPTITSVDSLGTIIDIFQNGGTFVLEGSIETRNRIIGDFGSTLFIDFGNSWESLHTFSINSIAIAFGFGFRYYTSFAPFRVDFGFKLYDPYKKEFNFNNNFFNGIEINLGIGEAF